VPSRAFAEAVARVPADRSVLVLTKGLDPVSGRRLSELVAPRAVAVLSGPNHAEEIAQSLPAAAVVASADLRLAALVQEAVHSARFRVYVNDDIVGVELAAAAKNVMALAAGGVDGLGLGDNAKAGVISRGLAEMARLGEACGARPETFAGLAGMGDLVVTCWSRHSRNRLAGELIARGAAPEQAEQEIGQVVEGIATAPALRNLARRLGVEVPLTEAVCAVLTGETPGSLVSSLMARRPTTE
jgi:glycerol-3-phosphate dehydrogenase (NAD(P)+)